MKYENIVDLNPDEILSEKEIINLPKNNSNNNNLIYSNHDAYHDSNIISKIFFCWVCKLFKVKFF